MCAGLGLGPQAPARTHLATSSLQPSRETARPDAGRDWSQPDLEAFCADGSRAPEQEEGWWEKGSSPSPDGKGPPNVGQGAEPYQPLQPRLTGAPTPT